MASWSFFVNLEPNLRRLAIFQTEMRASDADLESWLTRNGYRDNFFIRYGRWIGLVRKQPVTDPNTGEIVPRFRYCGEPKVPTYSGILQGDFGCSTAFETKVSNRLPQALSATGIMMVWVMIVMVPCSLLIGVLAGMREGSRLDRILSVLSIASTAAPEYVSGIIFVMGAPLIMMEMARTSTDMQMRSRLRELGMRLLPDSIVLEWHGDGATVRSYGGTPELIAADTLVTAATNISERSLGNDLNAPTIGYATAARNAAMAIYEGRKLAMGL